MYIPFSKISEWTEKNLGIRWSPNQAHRYRIRGVGGIKLQTWKIGGIRATDPAAIQAFIEATTKAADGDSATSVCSAANSKQVAQAEAYLASEGI